MADNNLSLFGSAIEQGLKLYAKNQDRSKLPANKRIFLETTLDNVKTPITEKELSKSEQDALKQLIQQKYAPLTEPLTQYKSYLEKLTKDKEAKNFYNPDQLAQARQDLKTVNSFLNGTITPDLVNLANLGKGSMVNSANLLREAGVDRKVFDIHPNIQYTDYNKNDKTEYMNTTSSGNANPQSGLRTLLGRFNYVIDPNNNIVVKDTYDFNNNNQAQGIEGVEASYDPAYAAVRMYAGEKVPPGQGRDVNISVPLAPLQYRDPFGFTIK